jgi:hypothetical protein
MAILFICIVAVVAFIAIITYTARRAECRRMGRILAKELLIGMIEDGHTVNRAALKNNFPELYDEICLKYPERVVGDEDNSSRQ